MSSAGEFPSGAELVDLVVTRTFGVPVDQVWNAWSDPDVVRQWWGPVGFTAPVAKMDFREGGTSLVCMRSPEGQDFYNTWTYQSIEPMRRIEFVLRFSDEEGRTVDPTTLGMPPGVPQDVRHVVTFEPVGDDTTRVTVTEYGYQPGPIFEMSKLGQEQCMDKMGAALTSSPPPN